MIDGILAWEVLDVPGDCVEAGPVPGTPHCPAPVMGASDQRGPVMSAVSPQGPHLALLPQQQHLWVIRNEFDSKDLRDLESIGKSPRIRKIFQLAR